MYPKRLKLHFFIRQIIAIINSSGLMVAQMSSEVSTDFHFIDGTLCSCVARRHNSCIGITIHIGLKSITIFYVT